MPRIIFEKFLYLESLLPALQLSLVRPAVAGVTPQQFPRPQFSLVVPWIGAHLLSETPEQSVDAHLPHEQFSVAHFENESH